MLHPQRNPKLGDFLAGASRIPAKFSTAQCGHAQLVLEQQQQMHYCMSQLCLCSSDDYISALLCDTGISHHQKSGQHLLCSNKHWFNDIQEWSLFSVPAGWMFTIRVLHFPPHQLEIQCNQSMLLAAVPPTQ